MGNGTFAPNAKVTREQFVKMIDTLYKGTEANTLFTDIDSKAWYVPYINKAVNSGIIKGISEDAFGIGLGVTREDMAVMIYRVLNDENVEATETFGDDNIISDYAKEAVYYLKNKGIITGTGEGNYEPKKVMTRAEAAVVINNVLNAVD
jgi:hypothetical protein